MGEKSQTMTEPKKPTKPKKARAQTARTPRSNRDLLEARRTRSRIPIVVERAPGPGTYRPVSFTDISQRPACGVHYREPKGTQRRLVLDPEKVKVPGPGAYDRHDEFGHDATFNISIGGYCSRDKAMDKVNIRLMNQISPGPNTYNPTYKPPSVSARIASAGKNCYAFQIGKASPGPATYNIRPQQKGAPAAYFGNTKRKTSTNFVKEDMPGPGDYNVFGGIKCLGQSGINGIMSTTTIMVGGRPISSNRQKDVPCVTKYSPKTGFGETMVKKTASARFSTGPRFGPITWFLS